MLNIENVLRVLKVVFGGALRLNSQPWSSSVSFKASTMISSCCCFLCLLFFLCHFLVRFSICSFADCLPLLLLSLLIAECASRPLYTLPSLAKAGTKKPLQTSRPFNVAHRGANGEFPEETAPAYMVLHLSQSFYFNTKLCPVSLRHMYLLLQRAIEEGADFIESDILSTKDGVLICHHDVNLDDTTDVADHKEFADRKRAYEVQGMNMTGFFTGKTY